MSPEMSTPPRDRRLELLEEIVRHTQDLIDAERALAAHTPGFREYRIRQLLLDLALIDTR